MRVQTVCLAIFVCLAASVSADDALNQRFATLTDRLNEVSEKALGQSSSITDLTETATEVTNKLKEFVPKLRELETEIASIRATLASSSKDEQIQSLQEGQAKLLKAFHELKAAHGESIIQNLMETAAEHSEFAVAFMKVQGEILKKEGIVLAHKGLDVLVEKYQEAKEAAPGMLAKLIATSKVLVKEGKVHMNKFDVLVQNQLVQVGVPAEYLRVGSMTVMLTLAVVVVFIALAILSFILSIVTSVLCCCCQRRKKSTTKKAKKNKKIRN